MSLKSPETLTQIKTILNMMPNPFEATTEIQSLQSGIIYSNPLAHVHSVHGYFPSVVAMDNGEMLCTIVLGEAFEAANLSTHISRSCDGGETWQLESRIPA